MGRDATPRWMGADRLWSSRRRRPILRSTVPPASANAPGAALDGRHAMSRVLFGAFLCGVALLAAALIAATASPASWAAVVLVIAAAAVLFGVVVAVFAASWRTKGWSLRHPGGGPRTP
jgi:hypothetical protein